jgi:hypothetical protein
MNTEKLLIEIRKSIEETQNRLTAVIALVEKLQDSIDEDLYEAYGEGIADAERDSKLQVKHIQVQ